MEKPIKDILALPFRRADNQENKHSGVVEYLSFFVNYINSPVNQMYQIKNNDWKEAYTPPLKRPRAEMAAPEYSVP